MTPGKLELSASKRAKTGSSEKRSLILLGLVIVLAVVVSWVTQGTLRSEVPAAPVAAVTDTATAQQPDDPRPEPDVTPVVEGIM